MHTVLSNALIADNELDRRDNIYAVAKVACGDKLAKDADWYRRFNNFLNASAWTEAVIHIIGHCRPVRHYSIGNHAHAFKASVVKPTPLRPMPSIGRGATAYEALAQALLLNMEDDPG